MTPDQLQDEYDKYHTIQGLDGVDMEGHLAGLMAVARLQAETDAQAASSFGARHGGVDVSAFDIAQNIRAQFEEKNK